MDSGEKEEESSLSSYVDLVDSFREIHRRTWPNSPALVSQRGEDLYLLNPITIGITIFSI